MKELLENDIRKGIELKTLDGYPVLRGIQRKNDGPDLDTLDIDSRF